MTNPTPEQLYNAIRSSRAQFLGLTDMIKSSIPADDLPDFKYWIDETDASMSFVLAFAEHAINSAVGARLPAHSAAEIGQGGNHAD